MADNPIFLNQVLHGYRDGHTLLASSMNLPPEVKRVMLPISDMSGGRILRGFEEYVTGYPLKQIHCYALAKTWYAPEMKRPGCVWTQTLLIDFDEVPRINSARALLSLFLRPPELEPNFSIYNEKILLEDNNFNDTSQHLNLRPPLDFQKMVLYNLYEFSDLSILLECTESNVFEDLFFKIWMQQWPRLKRNFSFCTGAISPRSFMGKPLDLQAIPFHYIDSSLNFEYKFLSYRYEVDKSNSEHNWVYLASESLYDSNEELGTFFKLFGSDVQGERAAFKGLTKAFIFLTTQKPKLQDCIEQIAILFTEPSNAYSLKNYLFGPKRIKTERNLPSYDERALLYYLSISNYYTSYDYKKLEYEKRFIDFFYSLREPDVEILKQIVKIGPNPAGEESLITLANELSVNNNLDLLWQDKQLSMIFILLNPRLAYNKRFWAVNFAHHEEVVHNLLQSSSNLLKWDLIIEILIDLRSEIDVNEINLDGQFIVNSILNAINVDGFTSLPENWLRYLRIHENEVLAWLNGVNLVQDKTVEILVAILNPNSGEVGKNGPEKWIIYFEQFNRSELNFVPLEVHAFCIALALNSNNPLSNKLYIYSLEIVYFALAKEILGHNGWRRIEIHTKPLGFFKDWDRCKKLVNAVVDHFIANNWNIYTLNETIQSNEIRERLANRYKKKR